MFFNGLPEMRIQNINIKDVIFTGAAQGAVIKQAEGVTLENVIIVPRKGPEIMMSHVKDIKINGSVIPEVGKEEKMISLK